MIVIEQLNVGYGPTPVLRDFSLTIKPGRIYALIGPSGCGKSTLLKVLAGIVPFSHGHITYHGKTWRAANVAIGYVPQHYGLLAWKTVEENIFLPMKVGSFKTPRPAETEAVINTLGIKELLHRYPAELSGGQQQRAALARAFVAQPDLLLMDEPFSALDAFTAATSQQLFLSLRAEWQVTTLFITHNIQEAVTVGEEILIMDPTTHTISTHVSNTAFGISSLEERQAEAAALQRKLGQVLQ